MKEESERSAMESSFGQRIRLLLGLAAFALPGAVHADCFDDAARYQHVNPDILRAIAWQESHGRPDAKHFNADGSVDFGMMQINSIHLRTLARYGVSRPMLMDPCVSVYVAAWHLKSKMVKYGNTWAAVGAYHSETPRENLTYRSRIEAIVRRLRLTSRLVSMAGRRSPPGTNRRPAGFDLPGGSAAGIVSRRRPRRFACGIIGRPIWR